MMNFRFIVLRYLSLHITGVLKHTLIFLWIHMKQQSSLYFLNKFKIPLSQMAIFIRSWPSLSHIPLCIAVVLKQRRWITNNESVVSVQFARFLLCLMPLLHATWAKHGTFVWAVHMKHCMFEAPHSPTLEAEVENGPMLTGRAPGLSRAASRHHTAKLFSLPASNPSCPLSKQVKRTSVKTVTSSAGSWRTVKFILKYF